jgi:uncharacterized membrane protein YkvI
MIQVREYTLVPGARRPRTPFLYMVANSFMMGTEMDQPCLRICGSLMSSLNIGFGSMGFDQLTTVESTTPKASSMPYIQINNTVHSAFGIILLLILLLLQSNYMAFN